MRHMLQRGRVAAAAGFLAVAGAAALVQGCSSAKDTLLEATDPDLINPGDVQNPEGAQALYVGTFARLRNATYGADADNPGAWLFGGLLADEWSTSSTYVQNDETDQRKVKEDNSIVTTNFRALNRVRTAANQAIAGLKKYRPTEAYKIAEMYFARGFVEAQMAQDFCNGAPVSDASGDAFVLGKPETTEQKFNRAIASYDSALALTGGTDANSVNINRAARIGKARALLGLNKLAEAVALVPAATVPTSYSYDMTMSATGGRNTIWGQGVSNRRFTVGDSIEGNARNLLVKNAIPFFSAKDPRLPVTYTVSARGDTTKGQDGFTFSRTTPLYGEFSPVSLVSGLDARLVEAEARLAANDFAGMTTLLNALRSAPPKVGDLPPLSGTALPALTAPTTRDAAVDLYFREKAFWTFSRGQRLGDLRRLVRFYGRTVENTFPAGPHYRGGDYGADVNFPVPTEERTNPNVGQSAPVCIDRKP